MFYENYIAENKAWIDEMVAKLDKKLSRVAVESREKLPYTTDENGKHDNCLDPATGKNVTWWTNGFWGGLMWLMYEKTGNEEYKKTAERSEELLDGYLANFQSLDHDSGFMEHILAGANYRLTGNDKSKNRNLYCAAALASRYNLSGGFIRAWNWEAGLTIIDTMMNLPQLYWASTITGDTRFKKIAMAHADMAMVEHIRPDGSVVHICSHDLDDGHVIETRQGQGYAVGSTWSRGASWAVYGFVLSYLHTGKQEYLDASKKAANYFIAGCATNGWLPPVDFRAPEEPVCYDSTAGAITACGLIELAKVLPEYEKPMYLKAAIEILKAMEKEFCNWEESTDYILGMGTEAYGRKVHVPIIYGDYFFAEAILKLAGSEFNPW